MNSEVDISSDKKDPDDSSDDDTVNADSAFYFESDHLALRGNRDYSNVLRTLTILEAQRVRLHQQLEELYLAKKRYMDNPELVIQKLKNGEQLIEPNQMTIAKLPEVSIKYEEFLPAKVLVKEEPGTSAKVSKVRGRVIDETKPETFNQLWTCEEQRELERLLAEYPAEEVEMRRYAKIAKALGNRTPQQVFSRVQKYFQKLHDAGMPIPGRKPKHRRPIHTKRKNIYRPSTFFPAYNVPVHMPEDDFLMGDLGASVESPVRAQSPVASSHCSTDDPADIPSTSDAAKKVPEALRRALEIIEAIRDDKLNSVEGYNPDPLAPKCEVCIEMALSTARWYCNTCCCAVNICGDCIVTQLLEKRFVHLLHDIVLENEI